MPEVAPHSGQTLPSIDESTLTAGAGLLQNQFTARPGDRFGPYKVLEEIGQGGCGAVFIAEQEQPVRRRVALKVIKLGMDTRQVIARFEAERQALAMMDHPNIAKVLDAGSTDTGRPFFVMELVRGIKITDYCDQHKLTTTDRLRLFMQVCQAVQHAHQKGIIHRDLKPSNILVTLQDGAAVPKVIDFGIAKATANQKLTDKTVYTALEQFIGTPAYMSPEQAEMVGLDIDTRSDIYSLGVLLYELLVGETPFSSEELLSVGLDDMRRTLREKDPAKPSTKLNTMTQADLTAIAQHRQSEPPKLIKLVRGDLDWVVMKCLEKDRNRRYETANGLAMDVKRYLANEPVAASPPGRIRRFQKLVRRNRLAFAAAGAVLASLIIGLGVSTWMFFKEQQDRHQAEAERRIAETEAFKSQQVAQFLKDMLHGLGPSVALGQDTIMLRGILDKTAERVSRDLKAEPMVEAELRNTLGDVYLELGEYQKAEAMQREALAMRRKWLGNEHLQVAESLRDLADALRREGKYAESETLLRDSLAIFRKRLGNGHEDVAGLLVLLGDVLRYEGKLDEAELMERQGLAMWKKMLTTEDERVGVALNNLALVLRSQGKLGEAEGMFREALALYKKVLGNENPEIAITLDNLADVLLDQGRWTEAETLERETLAMRRELLGNENPKVADSLNKLARVLYQQGKLAEAETMFHEAQAMLSKLPGSESLITADVLGNLAHLRQSQGELSEAETMEREALVIERRLQGDEGLAVGKSLAHLAGILLAEKKFADAEAAARECLSIRERVIPGHWRTFSVRSVLGGSLLGQKKYAEAEPLLLSGYEGMKQRETAIPAENKPLLNEALQRLVELYEQTSRSEQAAECKKELAELEKTEK
jgi:serine/threonine protein kinase/tetratricopeptide (TPR) repeat protein